MKINSIGTCNLSKSLNSHEILKSISVEFRVGEIHGIIGRNGSGKTVLLKCLSGLLLPSVGHITINGREFEGDISRHINIGAIIETPGFIPDYSGYRNLEFLARINNRIEVEEIKKIMISLGLNPNDKKKVQNYSLGMKQRLGIAQAIMERPDVLILDEPMNGIDNHGIMIIRQQLVSLQKNGCIIIIASHVKEDIEFLCSTTCLMDNGSLIKQRGW